jgi:hypothetical protein
MAAITLTYPQRREHARSNGEIYTSILALLVVLMVCRLEVVPAAQAGERWSEQLYQGSVSAVVTVTMTTAAAMGCGVPGSAFGVAPGIAGAAVCGSVAAYYAAPVSEWLIITLTPDQQLDELSILAGNIGGAILGAYGAAAAVGRLWLGNFATYSRSVRLATERTYKTARERIDPYELRGLLAGYDLDHALSVGCGYLLGVPASIMASPWNLQMLPSSENRSLGSTCRW